MEPSPPSPIGEAIEAILEASPSPQDFVAPVLAKLVRLLQFPAAELWVSTSEVSARRAGFCVAEGGTLQSAFESVGETLEWREATSLIAEVLLGGQTCQSSSIGTGLSSSHAPLAHQERLNLVQAYPLRAGLRTLGVLLLYVGPEQRVDHDSHRALAQLSYELGALLLSEQALEAQRESDAHYQAVVEASEDGVVTIDDLGVIVNFNRAAELMFGHSRSEALGSMAGLLLIPERTREQHRAGLERYRRTGESSIVGHRNELVGLHADGSEFPCELTVIETKFGGEKRFTGFLRNLTQAKLRDADQRRFQVISRWSNEAHVLLTGDGQIDFVNETAQRWIGAGTRALAGNDSLAVLPELGEQRLDDLIARLRRGPVEPFETLLLSADGTERHVEAAATRIDFGGDELVFLSLRDVSERRKARQELLERNERLADQDRRKDEFIALLAHELRNPLAPILSASEALSNDDLTADQQRLVSMIFRQSNTLKRLISDLLEAARLANGKVRVSRDVLDLRGPVEEAAGIARALSESRDQNLIVHVGEHAAWVEGDAIRFGQVVANLLDNAIKYTPNGGRIDLRLETDSEEVAICVRDTGRGIEPEESEAIFGAFQRENANHTLTESGLGLGLHLVKRLVEDQGGRVSVHSLGRGHGAEFKVTLPRVAAPEPVVTEPIERNDHRPVGARILIVDDHEDAASSLAILLRRRQHDVRVALDGRSAIAAAKEFQPQLVLLDIGMPGMNGYEVASRLRAEHDDLTIVGVSGHDSSSDARGDDFDHRLLKPVSSADLQPLLEAHTRS